MCCCSWGSVSMPWKRNRVLRVATKRGTHYLLWQPWLPLWQAILVRGASGVRAPARPVTLFRAFCFCLLFPTSSLTVILRFVSANLRDVALRPAPVLAAVHFNLLRRTDFRSRDPFVKRNPMNANFSSDFLRRVRFIYAKHV